MSSPEERGFEQVLPIVPKREGTYRDPEYNAASSLYFLEKAMDFKKSFSYELILENIQSISKNFEYSGYILYNKVVYQDVNDDYGENDSGTSWSSTLTSTFILLYHIKTKHSLCFLENDKNATCYYGWGGEKDSHFIHDIDEIYEVFELCKKEKGGGFDFNSPPVIPELGSIIEDHYGEWRDSWYQYSPLYVHYFYDLQNLFPSESLSYIEDLFQMNEVLSYELSLSDVPEPPRIPLLYLMYELNKKDMVDKKVVPSDKSLHILQLRRISRMVDTELVEPFGQAVLQFL